MQCDLMPDKNWTTLMIRTYSDLIKHSSFEDRFEYLSLHGDVGRSTFGFDRYLNQRFYTSREWKQLRNHVIIRDKGRDLGVEGYEIEGRLLIHHMNPVSPNDIVDQSLTLLDPEFLITTTHRTHNAIHYGDRSLLPQPFIERQRGDTKLW
ncbi:MAG TPA: hypothetical protein PLM10_02100 [Saccharofermentans sp.]|nr:hypothetical protein [Saccharofermentans sp.]